MSKKKTNIDKGSEDEVTGRFRCRQANSRNFVLKKEKLVGIFKDMKHDIFDLVTLGQTKLYTILLKALYYVCGIKFQKNGRNVKYDIKIC